MPTNRLAVDAFLTEPAIDAGGKLALSVVYPQLLATNKALLDELRIIRKHLESITGEEWDANDDD